MPRASYAMVPRKSVTFLPLSFRVHRMKTAGVRPRKALKKATARRQRAAWSKGPPYIPPGAQWYLAQIVEVIEVEGARHFVVHINTHLVRAANPREAHRKAVVLGRRSRATYLNPEGRKVRSWFAGLKELVVVHEPLEDGAELLYTRRVVRSKKKAVAFARPKSHLGVFAPRRPFNGPSYMPANIQSELEARFDSGPRSKRKKAGPGSGQARSRRKQRAR